VKLYQLIILATLFLLLAIAGGISGTSLGFGLVWGCGATSIGLSLTALFGPTVWTPRAWLVAEVRYA
jgi:hypothetical protein